jgi:hypothetical protein
MIRRKIIVVSVSKILLSCNVSLEVLKKKKKKEIKKKINTLK